MAIATSISRFAHSLRQANTWPAAECRVAEAAEAAEAAEVAEVATVFCNFCLRFLSFLHFDGFCCDFLCPGKIARDVGVGLWWRSTLRRLRPCAKRHDACALQLSDVTRSLCLDVLARRLCLPANKLRPAIGTRFQNHDWFFVNERVEVSELRHGYTWL